MPVTSLGAFYTNCPNAEILKMHVCGCECPTKATVGLPVLSPSDALGPVLELHNQNYISTSYSLSLAGVGPAPHFGSCGKLTQVLPCPSARGSCGSGGPGSWRGDGPLGRTAGLARLPLTGRRRHRRLSPCGDTHPHRGARPQLGGKAPRSRQEGPSAPPGEAAASQPGRHPLRPAGSSAAPAAPPPHLM